jgi:K(+)-stimulated pyrophosphate-energized sodium pump
MLISVRANVRTAQAASESLAKGLKLAFTSGAITGLLVAGFALIGVAGLLRVPDPGAGHGLGDRHVIDGWSRWASAPR